MVGTDDTIGPSELSLGEAEVPELGLSVGYEDDEVTWLGKLASGDDALSGLGAGEEFEGALEVGEGDGLWYPESEPADPPDSMAAAAAAQPGP